MKRHRLPGQRTNRGMFRALMFGLTTCLVAALVSAQGTWKPLRIGAGGWVLGIDIAADGTKVVKTDTYGAYVWNSSTAQWDQLITKTSINEASYKFRDDVFMGVYEIAIAPSDTDRFYMVWDGYVWLTDDKGASWSQTNFARRTGMDPNQGWRTAGQKMAVDPNDPDTVYVGSVSAGVWYTHDAGDSWTQISNGTIPFGSAPGHAGICFDPDSGVDGSGYTNEIIVPSYGNGVWRTVNAGSSWSQISGGPTVVWHAQMGPTGIYWCADQSAVWKWTGSWTSVTSSNYETVVIDPADGDRIIIAGDGGFGMRESLDGGSSWVADDTWWVAYPAPGNPRVADDIPWLEWTDEDYMSNGDMKIDPNDGKLYFAQGIGVWKTTFPTTFVAFDWTSQSKGIEQLVSNWIWSVPNGGDLFVTAWDRGVFRSQDPDQFPSVHAPTNDFQYGGSVESAVNDDDFLAATSGWTSDFSGYSANGGSSWNQFSSKPPGGARLGHIAVSTSQNMVWAANQNKATYYTKNGGTSWSAVPSPANGSSDWGTYNNRHIVCADRVTLNKFYLYLAGNPGLYVSTDSGDSWSEEYGSHIVNTADGYNAKLKAVPDNAGHLFFTNGPFGGGDHVGPDVGELFKRSKNSGVTWTTVSDVLEVYDFGFGKAAPGGSYPTIFIAGFVGSEWGVWMSDDDCVSWEKLGDGWPLGHLDNIKAVSGDMNVYGRCYVGFQGSGYAYYDPAGAGYGDPGVKRRGHMGPIILP